MATIHTERPTAHKTLQTNVAMNPADVCTAVDALSPVSARTDDNVIAGKLERLWQGVLEKNKKRILSKREFNVVYRKRLVAAYKLRREIYELKKLHLALSQFHQCRGKCGKCKGCLSASEKQGNIKLQKEKMSHLLDIYDVFVRFINREEPTSSNASHNKRPMLGQWLRLKGYTELLVEFQVWRREAMGAHQKGARNCKAAYYLRCPNVSACSRPSYYAYLVGDDCEPEVAEDVEYPRFRGRTKVSSPRKEVVLAKVRNITDEVAYWRAHTKSQRALLLAAMSEKEKYDTLSWYRMNEGAVNARAAYWRTELVARRYRVSQEKKEEVSISLSNRKSATKRLISMVTSRVDKYVYRCPKCASTSVYSGVQAHFYCATAGCPNYNAGAYSIKDSLLSPGSKVTYRWYTQEIDKYFADFSVQEVDKISGFDVVRSGGRVSYIKSDMTLFPVHSTDPLYISDPSKIYGDVYSSSNLGSVTSSVRVGNSSLLVKVSPKSQVDWSLIGKRLTYCKAKCFEFFEKLISGTPIYNTYGEICGIVTSSSGFSYTIGRPYLMKSMLIKPNDLYEELTKISKETGLKCALIKHSTRTAVNATQTAKALAEARIMTAISAGRTEAMAKEMAAVRELQNIADQKMSSVMNRALNINTVVRRKKNRRKVNQVVTTTVTL